MSRPLGDQDPDGSVDSTEEKVRPDGLKPTQLKLQFLAVGGAPILKKNKFQVRDSMTVAEVIGFLRKTLKIRDGDPLFLYINSSFAPSLEQQLKWLHGSFQVNDELLIQYAVTSSWG
jgi:ubiquitin-like protein ATG12